MEYIVFKVGDIMEGYITFARGGYLQNIVSLPEKF